MIVYSKDKHLRKIGDILDDVNKSITNKIYYIYGMKLRNRPAIRIHSRLNKKTSSIIEFLNSNNIDTKLYSSTDYEESYDEDEYCNTCDDYIEYCECESERCGQSGDEAYQVQIGLRKDLRDNKEYAAALIKMIISYYEGKLRLGKFKLPPIKLKDKKD